MFAAVDRSQGLFRTRFTFTNLIEIFLDPLLAVLCLFGAASYYQEPLQAHYIILALIAFSLTFPGSLHLADQPRRMVRKAVIGWSTVAAILFVFGQASGYERLFPNNVLLAWFISTLLALVGAHLLTSFLVPKVLANGHQSRAVIAGVNDIGMILGKHFFDNKYLGIRLIGYFDDRNRDRLSTSDELNLLGTIQDLPAYIRQHRIEHIYLALPMAAQPRILALLDDLKDTTASIFFVPDIFITDIIQGRMDNIHGMPVVAICETPFTGINGIVKRVSDILLAIIILILIAPVLLMVALAVKFTSRGPIIFKQRRYGLDGKEIIVYKFRSMTVCEDGATVQQATQNDRRITPVGGFLRKTSLDELPQFINVLQGRMSIVGPRPHAVAHNETYRKLIKGYMVRHKVKPGITGWAQVNGCRGETETIDKMEKRIEYDLEYLRHWSLTHDFWIIIKTIWLVVHDRNAY